MEKCKYHDENCKWRSCSEQAECYSEKQSGGSVQVERLVRCIFYGDCPFNTIDCEETNGHYKCEHRVVGEMVRIRYWQQETMESGGWRLTGLMPAEVAKKMIESTILERPRIVEDSEYT